MLVDIFPSCLALYRSVSCAWKMNKWIDMWIYDIVKPVHLYKYFSKNASTIIPISTSLPHCKCFYQLHTHPIYLNSCQLWCTLCAQMGRILISFTVQMHPMFQWLCKLWNIWVTSNLWHLCPFGCIPQISKTVTVRDIHTLKSALFYSTGVSP